MVSESSTPGKTSDFYWKKNMVPSQLHRTSSGAVQLCNMDGAMFHQQVDDGGWLFHANGFWHFWASEHPNHKDAESLHISTNRHIHTWLNTYSMHRKLLQNVHRKEVAGLAEYWNFTLKFQRLRISPRLHTAILTLIKSIQRSFFTPIESRWMKPPRRT